MVSVMEPLAILVGPTAVGKTALSLPVAQALQAEVLNVDSRQLYRYMDIGTAKPTSAERAQVPHHLLNLLRPDQRTNAAQFVQAARRALDDICARGKRVLIVGGSGLYLQALLYGLMPAPAAHEPLRRALRAHAEVYGAADLHRWLQRLDPEAASSYHPHDRVRLIRALEVIVLTGERFSVHRHQHQRQGALYPYVAVGLTRERTELYARIAERTKAMLRNGWLAEVEALLARGYTRACAAMNSLGYRELLAYLDGELSWSETVHTIIKLTRQLAKRQLTWFRKLPHLSWLSLTGLDEQAAVAQVLSRLQRPLRSESSPSPSGHGLLPQDRQPRNGP
jgi:tRNA dimethylallyltransferase